jgi:hypothetical protein
MIKPKQTISLLLALTLTSGLCTETFAETGVEEESPPLETEAMEIIPNELTDSEEEDTFPEETETTTTEQAEEKSSEQVTPIDDEGDFSFALIYDEEDFSYYGRAVVGSSHSDFGGINLSSELEFQASQLDEAVFADYYETFGLGTYDGADFGTAVFSTGVGTVQITSSKSISYDNWSTHLYSAGGTVAYCGNTSMRYKTGSMSTYLYTGSDSYSGSGTSYQNETVYQLLKAALLVAPGGRLYSTYGGYLFGGSLGLTKTSYDQRYAYMHTLISFLYSGKTTGTTSTTKTWVNNAVAWLYSQISDKSSTIYAALASTNLYVANPNGVTYQPYLWIESTPEGQLKITKSSANKESYSWGSQYTCYGAIFGIYTAGSTSNNTVDQDTLVTTVTTSISNGDGTYSTPVLYLSPGTYYVQEVYAPHGYQISSDVKQVTVASSTLSTTTISDSPMLGMILAGKRNADDGTLLNGATISLYSNSGCTSLVSAQTTGTATVAGYTKGYAQFSELHIGSTYYAKETVAPAGYQLGSSAAQSVTIGSEWNVVSKSNSSYGNISVSFNSQGRFVAYLSSPTAACEAFTGTDGCELVLYCTATSKDGKVKTDKTGYFFTKSGSYYYASAYLNQHLGLNYDGTYYFTVVAEKQSFDSNGTLTGMSQQTIWSGQATLSDLNRNMSLLNRYEVNFQNQKIQPVVAEVQSDYSHTIDLTKESPVLLPSGEKVPVSGAEFTLRYQDDSGAWVEKTATTDAEGKASWTTTYSSETYLYLENLSDLCAEDVSDWLAVDTTHRFKTKAEAVAALKKEIQQASHSYTLSETKTPYGWATCEPQSFTITGGKSSYTTLENYAVAITEIPNRGSISISKTDASNQPVEGVTYALYTTLKFDSDHPGKIDSKKTYTYQGITFYLVSESTTDGAGKLVWTDLYADGNTEYLVVETFTAEGLTLLKDPIYVGTLPKTLETEPTESYTGTCYQEDEMYHYFDVSYTVSDGSSFTMPATGGNGIFPAVAAGFCALLAGWVLLDLAQKKKNKNLEEI